MNPLIAATILAQLLQPVSYQDVKPAVPPILERLAVCESQNRPWIKVWDSNNAWSYGVLQFQAKTFIAQIGHFGMLPESEPAERLNYIYDGDVQLELATRMLRENWDARHNWENCWKKLKLPVQNPGLRGA